MPSASSQPTSPSASVTSASPSPTPSATPTPTPSPTPTPTPSVDPGTLPQTEDKPSASDPEFAGKMQLLWTAIASGQQGDVEAARAAFFPLTAYRQVKGISDPDGDYRDRLIAMYDLDIKALHDFVGPGATFVRVDVPDGAAQWMPPGSEFNKGPYWRVLGTRMVVRTAAGAEKSFGVTSMISWRGQWYVVHLGPFTRPGGTGAITY